MAWWVWLILSVVLGVIELTSMTFVLLWIAIAALLTCALTPIVPQFWVQVLIFAAASVILYAVTRPLARRWRKSGSYTTHLESRLNQRGVVVSGGPAGSFATVRIQGELWSATSHDALQAGQTVVVTGADGPVLSVKLADQVEGAQ